MTKFIIDTYNKYDPIDKAASRLVFLHNDQWWAIKEFQYEDGQLRRPIRIEEPENINEQFFLYDTYADAYNFVKKIRGLG